jgi:hypothetical protein
MRPNYGHIKRIISKSFECSIIEARCNGIVLIFSEGTDDEQRVIVRLVDGRSCEQDAGIHLRKLHTREDLVYHLNDAVETALKDGWHRIYIHRKPKASEERRLSRAETAKGWLKPARSGKGEPVPLNCSLSRLEVDAEAVIDSMTEDQLDVLLAMVAGTYQQSHTDSREHWAPMYHNLRKALEARGLTSIETLEIADRGGVR